jgi:hypothetical protein
MISAKELREGKGGIAEDIARRFDVKSNDLLQAATISSSSSTVDLYTVPVPCEPLQQKPSLYV